MKRSFPVLLTALLLQGCAYGYGPTFPSQERARSVVDTRVCLETEAGCAPTREQVKETPVQSYSAFVLPMLYVGGGSTRAGDTRFGTVTTNVSAEYMRGHGPWALGARGDVVVGVNPGGKRSPSTIEGSLMPVAHYGINDMFSTYVGLGTGLASTAKVAEPTSGTWIGRGLVGFRMGLVTYRGAKILKSRLLLNVEGSAAKSLLDSRYESWNLTGGFMLVL